MRQCDSQPSNSFSVTLFYFRSKYSGPGMFAGQKSPALGGGLLACTSSLWMAGTVVLGHCELQCNNNNNPDSRNLRSQPFFHETSSLYVKRRVPRSRWSTMSTIYAAIKSGSASAADCSINIVSRHWWTSGELKSRQEKVCKKLLKTGRRSYKSIFQRCSTRRVPVRTCSNQSKKNIFQACNLWKMRFSPIWGRAWYKYTSIDPLEFWLHENTKRGYIEGHSYSNKIKRSGLGFKSRLTERSWILLDIFNNILEWHLYFISQRRPKNGVENIE